MPRVRIIAIARETGDREGLAWSLKELGNLAYVKGDHDAAKTAYEESLTHCRAIDDRHGIAGVLHNLGSVALGQEDYARARQLYEESLMLERELGDRTGEAITLNGLGTSARFQGDDASRKNLKVLVYSPLVKRKVSKQPALLTLQSAAGPATLCEMFAVRVE